MHGSRGALPSRLIPNHDFGFHDKNHGNFIFNSTLTPLTGDLTSPKHIINHPNSHIAGGVDAGLSDAKSGTSAATAECARRAF